jgi:hypothetical protein
LLEGALLALSFHVARHPPGFSHGPSGLATTRGMSDDDQFKAIIGLVMKNKPSEDFCGYWRRRIAFGRGGA